MLALGQIKVITNMKLFNTLSSKVEELQPLCDRNIGMYTCGPTVYDVAHIGNLRKYLCDDVLFRALTVQGYRVKRVMNITDVDDKTIKGAEGKRIKFDALTKKYEESFFVDLEKMNICKPDVITRATAYIDKMVLFIEELLKKDYAYRANDGSIYFSINKFKDYGKLSKLENREIMVGARISQDEYDKENPSDFALWKAWDENDGEIYWETSLGKGRPGWHIECSTMAMDTLGDTIDIHTGGVDNIFPHHENEIAQSEAKSGKKFVNIWVHNEHLLVDGKKMSKSLGNFYRLSDLEAKGFSPLDFRYFILGAHYRSKINFTWAGLKAAQNARERMQRIVNDLPKNGRTNEAYSNKFEGFVSNDLDLPQALAVAWEMLRDETVSDADKRATMLGFDEVLGLDLGKIVKLEIPSHITKLAEERKKARINNDFEKSDHLRDEIADQGWIVEDKPQNEYELRRK